ELILHVHAPLFGIFAHCRKTTRDRHRTAHYPNSSVDLHLPLTGTPLQLLNGVSPHPKPRSTAADIPTAWRHRCWTGNGDVALVEEVQALTFLDAEELEALDPERMEETVPVVRILEVHVIRRDASRFIELARHAS